MCDFISWIEYNGEVFFLDDNKLNTKEGRKLLKCGYRGDILGHGAIRHYYPELKAMGKEKECTDFSSPKNFPPEIVKAIKGGLFSQFYVPNGIINKNIFKSAQKADADWGKADADWGKADADREKAEADWKKACADREKACADREKAEADWMKAYADWEKVYADREKACADREKADRRIFWSLASKKKNRIKVWK